MFTVDVKQQCNNNNNQPTLAGSAIGKNDFARHFKEIIARYNKIGYNIGLLRQTACLVVNPIKVNSFAYLFNCTTIGRASD